MEFFTAAFLYQRIALSNQSLLTILNKDQRILLFHHILYFPVLLLGHINRGSHQSPYNRIFPIQQTDNTIDSGQLDRVRCNTT